MNCIDGQCHDITFTDLNNCSPNDCPANCPFPNACDAAGQCGCTAASCPTGQTCTAGVCVCANSNCKVTTPCGSNLVFNDCGNVCIGVANQCGLDAQGKPGTCDGGQCICGVCTARYECGPASATGIDDCNQPLSSCTRFNASPTPYTTCINDVCRCTSQSGVCTPLYQCGPDSVNGIDNCGYSCTLPQQGTCTTPPRIRLVRLALHRCAQARCLHIPVSMRPQKP